MASLTHKGDRKAAKAIARKARAGCSAYVMKPEYLAEIERFRLMDDTFMSKCLENASEMYFEVLKKRVSQFKDSEEGRQIMCEAMERIEAHERMVENAISANSQILTGGGRILAVSHEHTV